MSPVGYHYTESSHFPIQYITKEYRIFTRFMHLLLKAYSPKEYHFYCHERQCFQKHNIPEFPIDIWSITQEKIIMHSQNHSFLGTACVKLMFYQYDDGKSASH